jgi:tetratricopeptide (TPR) repeat protein
MAQGVDTLSEVRRILDSPEGDMASRYAQAAALLCKGLEQPSADFRIRNKLAGIYIAQGRFEEAEELLPPDDEEAKELLPPDDKYWGTQRARFDLCYAWADATRAEEPLGKLSRVMEKFARARKIDEQQSEGNFHKFRKGIRFYVSLNRQQEALNLLADLTICQPRLAERIQIFIEEMDPKKRLEKARKEEAVAIKKAGAPKAVGFKKAAKELKKEVREVTKAAPRPKVEESFLSEILGMVRALEAEEPFFRQQHNRLSAADNDDAIRALQCFMQGNENAARRVLSSAVSRDEFNTLGAIILIACAGSQGDGLIKTVLGTGSTAYKKMSAIASRMRAYRNSLVGPSMPTSPVLRGAYNLNAAVNGRARQDAGDPKRKKDDLSL